MIIQSHKEEGQCGHLLAHKYEGHDSKPSMCTPSRWGQSPSHTDPCCGNRSSSPTGSRVNRVSPKDAKLIRIGAKEIAASGLSLG